jgi:Glycosyltransferase family 87
VTDPAPPEIPITEASVEKADEKFWPVFGNVVLYTLAAFVVIIAIACDYSPIFENSDYTSCIYVGAKLFALQRFADIYAPYNAVDFYHTPCDIAAHQFLPHLNPEHISLYNYCPLVAWLLSPLSYLSPTYSLMAWQAISLAALVVSVIVLIKGWRSRLKILAASLLFFPIAVTLWIGQMDLVFGLLFFALGYRLLKDGKSFWAGTMFAAACLKPQMLILAVLLGCVLLLKRNWQFTAGFMVGGAILAGANIGVGGIDLSRNWIWSVRLAEKVFTDPRSGLAHYLIVSAPGVLLLTVFKNPIPWVKPLIYSANLVIIAAVVYICMRFSKLHPKPSLYIGYTITLGLLTMPLLIPNYLYYDFTLLFLAACIALDDEFQQATEIRSTWLILATIVLLNAYAIVFMANRNIAVSTLPLIVLIVLFRRVAIAGLAKDKPAIELT